LFHGNRKASATENRAQILGCIDELHEHIVEEQVMDGCLPCPRWYEMQQKKQGAAILPTPQAVQPVMQPGPMLQPHWPPCYIQTPLMPQPAPIPQLSGCTLSNCTINTTSTKQPQPQLQADYSNIGINEFLNFWHY